jgi:translation initiation factor 1 (eIF-1/SUI1)
MNCGRIEIRTAIRKDRRGHDIEFIQGLSQRAYNPHSLARSIAEIIQGTEDIR